MEISVETPVEDVMNAEGNRSAFMTRLASLEFGRSGGAVLRAYTQFGWKSLGAVIEAKRKGVFDYGITLRELEGTGAIAYPRDTAAVMKVIDLAAEGKYDDVDLKPLGIVGSDGTLLVDYNKLFPGVKAKAGKVVKEGAGVKAGKTSSVKGNDVAVMALSEAVSRSSALDNKAVDAIIRSSMGIKKLFKSRRNDILLAGGEQSLWDITDDGIQALGSEEELPPEPEAEELVEAQAAVAIKPVVMVEPDVDHGSALNLVLSKIDTLAANLAESLQTVVDQDKSTNSKMASVIEDEIGYVKNEIENVKAGLLGVVGYLDTIDQNMRSMLLYFVDPNMEFVDPPQDVKALLELSVPEDLEERLEVKAKTSRPTKLRIVKKEEAEPKPQKEQHSVHDGTHKDCSLCTAIRVANKVEKKAKASKAEKVSDNGSSGMVEIYSVEQLKGMDLAELRHYAGLIGITPARFPATLINRIVAYYKENGLKF